MAAASSCARAVIGSADTGQDQGRNGDQPGRDGLAVQGLGLGREREAVTADVIGEGPEPARADAGDGRRVAGPQR
jgi:hypothetical protein